MTQRATAEGLQGDDAAVALAAAGTAGSHAATAATAAAVKPARDDTTPEREHASLPTRQGLRSVSLAIIALLACIYALHWASAVFIPLLLA